MKASPKVPASSSRMVRASPSTSRRRRAVAFPARSAGTPGPGQHRGVEVHAGHVVAGGRERDRQATRADGKLEDPATGPGGQREIEVEIARVIGEIEVVQAREGLRVRLGRRRGRRTGGLARGLPTGPPGCRLAGHRDTARSWRIVWPASRLAASAEMTSRATRLAAIAVTSAWS